MGHIVRIPVALRASSFSAPSVVHSSSFSSAYDVTFGYSGSFSPTFIGLSAATTFSDTIAGGINNTCGAGNPDAKYYPVTVLATTKFLRVTTTGTGRRITLRSYSIY